MDVPDALLDRGDDRLHVGGGERVHEVDTDRRDDLVGAEMHREQTVRALDARMGARDRADRRDHFQRGRLTDEEPLGLAGEEHSHDSRTPMPMDAAPSSTERSNASLVAIPARAIIKPISAAVSSKSTMNMVGSLL